MVNWDLKDLEYWDDAIRERVAELGLDCYPQEFEVCDHGQMLGFMAYHGMPAHYPHWSFGKSYENNQDHVRPRGHRSALRDGDQLRTPALPI